MFTVNPNVITITFGYLPSKEYYFTSISYRSQVYAYSYAKINKENPCTELSETDLTESNRQRIEEVGLFKKERDIPQWLPCYRRREVKFQRE